MTYIDKIRDDLAHKLPGTSRELLDLYTLVALVKGEDATHEDVHHAWALWTRTREPGHRYMLPFDELSPEVQELDAPYLEAIRAVAAKTKEVTK